MTLKRTATLLLLSALAACNAEEKKAPEPAPVLTEVKHDRFRNGWYAVIHEKGGIPMQLHGSKETFTIDPTEIATQQQFREVSIAHDNNCDALRIRLDSTGSEALDLAIQFIKSKKLGLIINNELYYVQDLNQPFAKVKKGTPATIFGETIAIPCNALPATDLQTAYSNVALKK